MSAVSVRKSVNVIQEYPGGAANVMAFRQRLAEL
jgi:hypothetical protein